MKGLANRRYVDEKIATKRWNYFHGDKQHQHQLAQMGVTPVDFSPHKYHKAKGCECRSCTSNKQVAKHQLRKRLRREVYI